MGALIAGVTLSAFPYSLDLVAKIRSPRDFFVTLFFVALGMQLQIDSPQVILGFHRVASSLVQLTQGSSKGHDVLVVDFSPEVYRALAEMDVPVVYGDISHLDTLEHVGIERASVIISTVSEDFLRGTDNLTLLRQIRLLNPDARVVLSAETLDRARAMYAAGADYVVLPRVEAAQAFLDVLETIERGELGDLREQALADLADRQEVLA